MALALPCPPIGDLERFLLGHGDEESSKSCEAHVTTCNKCQQAMQGLTARDEMVAALARCASEKESSALLRPAPRELIDLLIPRLKRIPLDQRATTFHAVAPGEEDTAARVRSTILHVGPDLGGLTSRRLGHYEIRGILGSGGMGTVLEAYDTRLKRLVAIKVVQSRWVAEPGMLARFIREAQSAAAVEHDHIVTIHSVEIHDGIPCIVMPLLRGKTLKHRIDEVRGPLPLAETLRVGIEACQGLAAAHHQGLIHRDIKPANLWLEESSGRLKILDFGLAQQRSETNCDNGEISGTPGFVSPEQARGFAVDARSDLFSLGCVLYLIASGKQAFGGPTSLQSLWTAIAERPAPAISLNPALPKELSDLIDELVALKCEDRPSTADVVCQRLLSIKRAPIERRERTLRRRRFIMLGGGMVLTGAAVGAWAMTTRQPFEPPVSVSLSSDVPGLTLILRRDGTEQKVTLNKTLDLAPGEYEVSVDAAPTGQTVWPDRIEVTGGMRSPLTFTLIGEAAKSNSHTRPVTGVALQASGDSVTAFSVSLDRTLVSWSIGKSEAAATLQLPHSARCLAISPTGEEIAIAGGNKQQPTELTISRWRSNSLEPIGSPLGGYERAINAIRYSPDGAQLTTCGADGVWIWDLKSHEPVKLPQSAQNIPNAMAYSPDGGQILTVGEAGSVNFWAATTKRQTRSHSEGEAAFRAVCFLPNGFAVAGDDGVVRIWDNATTKWQLLKGHRRAIHALAASAKGEMLYSAGDDGMIRIWLLPQGIVLHEFRGHVGAIHSLALAKDGRTLLSGGADNTVRYWRLPVFE